LEEEVAQEMLARQQQVLKTFLEGLLEGELVERLAAARYRRTEVRRGYRNGYYERSLVTQLGAISGLRVPRARTRLGERAVFRRYQRRQARVHALIREAFLAGISTRRVGAVLEGVLGESVSAQTVSRIAQSLQRDVDRFHEAPLTDNARYLFLDGVSMRVKGASGVKRRLVLCAYVITVRGERRLLDFRLGQSESTQAWEAFLRQLERRGLAGRHLKLVITDGCAGLAAALETVYPYVPRQRCWAHKLRNVSNLLRRSQQRECLAGARSIYLAATWRAGVQAYWAWAHRWRGEAPNAVACLERDLDELLNFLRCPERHRRKIRTTNAIERCFREVRRRTRPMSCFTNSASCERIIYAVISHLNRSWEGKRLSEITQE
jgi:transposase-like protein